MAEEFECDKCGKSFDSERGLNIHKSQVHTDEEEDNKGSEEQKREETDDWSFTVRVPALTGRKAFLGIFLLGIAVGFGAGYVAPDIGSPLKNSNGGSNSGEGGSKTVDVSKINNEGDPVLGEKDANVTMVVYEDFECPFCRRFEGTAVRRIEKNYVNSGKVKIVWKDFPLARIHPWATAAAETMECVQRHDQDAFWRVKNQVFKNQKNLNQENVQDKILNWSAAEGVPKQEVKICLESGNPQQEVREDISEGRSFEVSIGGSSFVSGTPAAVIYGEGDQEGTPIVGAQPYSRFESVIESKLG